MANSFFLRYNAVTGSWGNKHHRHHALCFVTRAQYAIPVTQLLPNVELIAPHKF